jgi:RNA polymerase sigma-70 factor (ECF subfamily)
MVPERERRWQSYLAGIALGKSECLTLLYDESAGALLGLALRMMKNKADAEEILLDVFEQVWRKAESFDPARGSVWRWLTMMLRSRAVDRLRTATARYDRDRILPLAEEQDPISHEPLPDSATILSQERTFIRTAILLLPGEQRQALELAYFSGLTHVEIASELGVPLGTIKTRIRSAVDKLRISLSQSGFAAAAGSTQ